MTRAQAFEVSAMDGMKIIHRYFSSDEYIQVLTNNSIRTEEGYTFDLNEFMEHRQGSEWENGWSIYQD